MYGVTSSPGKVGLLYAVLIAVATIALCASRPSPSEPGTIVGDRWLHLVTTGETWETIGARVGVAPGVLAALNERTLRVPLRSGDLVAIDNRHVAARDGPDELVINVPQRMLFHYWGGVLRAQYPVALGRPETPTAFGRFTVVAVNAEPGCDEPVAHQTDGLRPGGRPRSLTFPDARTNSSLRYWIELTLGGVGVQATTTPASIYQFSTHGGVRLHPDDIADLSAYLAAGAPGRVIYEPVLVGHDGRETFLEVHQDAYRRGIDLRSRAWQRLDETGLRTLVDPERVERAVRAAEGLAVQVTGTRDRWPAAVRTAVEAPGRRPVERSSSTKPPT